MHGMAWRVRMQRSGKPRGLIHVHACLWEDLHGGLPMSSLSPVALSVNVVAWGLLRGPWIRATAKARPSILPLKMGRGMHHANHIEQVNTLPGRHTYLRIHTHQSAAHVCVEAYV